MKKRIVIAEDDLDILFTLNVMLENAGYEVILSSSGKYVLEADYSLPDLFILDKRMPDMDGLDVCRTLRTRPEFKAIPIIIISASPKFGHQALDSGADDFLAKPFEMRTLLQMVELYTGDGFIRQVK